jgi:hypothetical protein
MTAPSLNLRFTEGDRFRTKTAPVHGLSHAITEFLRSWPNQGELVCRDVRQMKFWNGGRNYVVVYTRRTHLVGLMNLFETPKDDGLLKDYLEMMRTLYCGGKK